MLVLNSWDLMLCFSLSSPSPFPPQRMLVLNSWDLTLCSFLSSPSSFPPQRALVRNLKCLGLGCRMMGVADMPQRTLHFLWLNYPRDLFPPGRSPSRRSDRLLAGNR